MRDYNYVSDTVDAFLLAGEKAAAIGEVFNVGSGKATSIKELVSMIVSLFELEGRIKISYTNKSWPGDIKTLLADTSKIEKKLGFKSKVNLKTGLRMLKTWILEN